MGVHVFNRILERNHMDSALFVDAIEQRGKRCRFTGTGCTSEDDDTVELISHSLEGMREMEDMMDEMKDMMDDFKKRRKE